MHKLVFCRPLHPDAMALLAARKDVEVVQLAPDFRSPPVERVLPEHIRDAFGVMLAGQSMPEALLMAAPELRVISRFGVGYDGVDIPTCTKRGILVCVANGANDLSVAEHAMMLMLAVARRTVEYDASVRAGTWMLQTGRRMHELAGRKVLVIGYGRIGTRVARLCKAFGMTTMVSDPAFPTPRIAADGHIPVTKDVWAAIPEADVVTLHCPLDDVTRGMVNAAFLKRMKPTAWLINTARGPIVDEPALAAALADGTIEAAGLDVLAREPEAAGNPLFDLPNVVLSPHNATRPQECFVRVSRRAVLNLLDFIDGTIDPGYTVNPEVLGRNAA
jgi:D-3-phosphoglycerate dehydrogenase